ncbi:MAG: twin-arginine translocase TatA/TatE family subunit [Anaerolineales bacterium]
MPLGIQPIHIVIIVLVALLIFGPRKLPERGRSMGKMINEFRNGTRDITSSFQMEANRPVAPLGNASQMETSTAIPAASSPGQTPTVAHAPAGNFCIQCGSANAAEAHFCNQCRAKLPDREN